MYTLGKGIIRFREDTPVCYDERVKKCITIQVKKYSHERGRRIPWRSFTNVPSALLYIAQVYKTNENLPDRERKIELFRCHFILFLVHSKKKILTCTIKIKQPVFGYLLKNYLSYYDEQLKKKKKKTSTITSQYSLS